MPNLTISMDENLIKLARIRAIQDGTSLSAKVREMLTDYVRQAPQTPHLMVTPPLSPHAPMRLPRTGDASNPDGKPNANDSL